MCAGSIRVMHPLFQAAKGGSIPTPALTVRDLWVEPIAFSHAKRLNKLWHSRLPRFGTGCVEQMKFPSYAAHREGWIYAVAIWSNPVARNLPQHTWLELRRMAIAPDRPDNTASWMLSKMVMQIRRSFAWLERLVSYQDLGVHTGTIYRAAGWTATTINKDGNWTREYRQRPKAQSESPKQRWELAL